MKIIKMIIMVLMHWLSFIGVKTTKVGYLLAMPLLALLIKPFHVTFLRDYNSEENEYEPDQ